jgi:hypothetical protein
MNDAATFEGDLKVRSIVSIGRIATDYDIGVVRVFGAFLRSYAHRNALVRISVLDDQGQESRSIVRIVRAATLGKGALKKDEIALQYDDRLELGVKKAGTIRRIRIRKINEWLGLPAFLIKHPSPLVRKETIFALAMMIIGALFGFLLGLAVSLIM